MVAISISGPKERTLPAIGFLELEDAETGETIIIDTKDPELRKTFATMVNRERSSLKNLFRSIDVDHVELFTNAPYIDSLLNLFRIREKRL